MTDQQSLSFSPPGAGVETSAKALCGFLKVRLTRNFRLLYEKIRVQNSFKGLSSVPFNLCKGHVMVFAGFWTTGLPSVENKIWQSPLYPEFACAICPLVFSSTI